MLRFDFLVRKASFCGLLAIFAAAHSAVAEDVYFEVPVNTLKITKGTLPSRNDAGDSVDRWEWRNVMPPYAVLDGEGEIYVGRDFAEPGRFTTLKVEPEPARKSGSKQGKTILPRRANRSAIAIRVAKPRTVTGTLFLPRWNFSSMTRIRFSVDASKSNPKAKRNFYLTKSEHYEMLQELGGPGSAWFRYEAALAKSIATGKKPLEPIRSARRNEPAFPSDSEIENTFDVFSGGRAISENLQLDRLLPATKPGPANIDVKTLPGITVAEMDWTKLTKDIKPKLDPLAKVVPHDQHVIFFRSFRAMTKLIDEADSFGTPLLHVLQSRAESARSKERYLKQLCLEVSAVSRLLGPRVVRGVAFTGSDPYLPTGTDVAVLFEAKSSILLKQFLISKHVAAEKAHPDCKRVKGTEAGLEYVGAVSPDRRICSYIAAVDNVVVVTNSLVQIRRLAETHAGKTKNLASLPEYRFFRHRYQRDSGSESALLVVTDATIRRWCGPKWRIANSRRTRAAAVMAHYQAEHLAKIVAGGIESTPIETKLYVPDLGVLQLTKNGVTSTEYGSLEFMTPIAELIFDKVTESEARTYRGWRVGYQRYWRQFFDPIAVRISQRDDRLAADVTVMPLINQSEYREFIELTTGASIKANTGDPHAGTLLHWTMAVNLRSTWVRNTIAFIPINPLSWLGDSISVYVDADPFWLDFAKVKDEDKGAYVVKHLSRFPVAFQAEVKEGLKLALVMTALRTYVDNTVPGLLTWETLKHKDRQYVKVNTTRRGRQFVDSETNLALYYLVSGKALIVTFNEPLLKRAIDRDVARTKAAVAKKPAKTGAKPWLGKSMALQIDRRAFGFLEASYGNNYQQMMQARAWANLPVLNEWKRRYTSRNPVEMHRNHWNVELRCPGGGKYVWNEKHQTMESTVYGHPGVPKTGPKLPAALRSIRSANFGVTFEHKGLRARMEIERGKK